jgi:GT2 family glycosyltransferase
MFTVITAVHNQLAMNRLFHKYLVRYTAQPFQLVIVDNNSTDGSREFFKSVGADVIENDGNYSYGHCQNQGIAQSRYDYMAFLNNDLLVPPRWDELFVRAMQRNGLDVVTACGVEHLENKRITKQYKRRWNMIKNTLLFLGGATESNLERMHKLMYCNWEKFCTDRAEQFNCKIKEGFVGCAVAMHKSAIDKIGLWDPRIQGADFDLYLRTKQRSLEHGDIKPCHIALDVFVNHYIRLTLKSKPKPFTDRYNLMTTLEEKWGSKANELLAMRDLT